MNTAGRDLRLDFFRGLSLIFIFVDHIPGNLFSYLTLSNFAFNDAAEVFVFISGYSAAVVFGGILARHGVLFAAAQVLKRCWTLYVIHIFLFMIFTAQVSYTAVRFANPLFIDEMNIANFLQEPHIAVLKALALQLQPAFMNILPLYILLLLGFVLVLPLLRVAMVPVLAVSFALYLVVPIARLNLDTYPAGQWYFNPFAWQALFVSGAALALTYSAGRQPLFDRYPLLVWLSAGFVGMSAAVRIAIAVAEIYDAMPPALAETIWLLGDKTALGPLRLLNFFAIAHIAVYVIRRDSAMLALPLARLIVLCGQHSLNIFCLGIFLSFAGHLMLIEIGRSVVMQFAVTAAGIAIMIAVAQFLSWSKSRSRAATVVGPAPAMNRGGE